MTDRVKVLCPVCDKTIGFVEVPSSGYFRTKCQRCGKEIRIDMKDAGAVKMRMAAKSRPTAKRGVPSNGLRRLSIAAD